MATASNRPIDDEQTLRVRRGRVDSVDLYEIKDSELDVLESGSPAGLQLNFAVFMLSIAFSAICALATATFGDRRVETVFTLVAIVGVLFGFYLLLAWYRTRTSLRQLCKEIRSRIQPDVLLPPPSDAPVDSEETTRPAG